KHLMIGKAFGDEVAEHPLDSHVDLGHQIDRAFFPDANVAAERSEVQLARANDGFDGCGEEELRRTLQDHAWTRFVMRISIPPSGARCRLTSSMKLRMRKMPRPLDFSRFSGASGSAISSGSNPSP